MITFKHKGDFSKVKKYLEKTQKMDISSILQKYGEQGKNALADSTPIESGKTRAAWGYEIEQNPGQIKIIWTNSNINKNVNIALILQYGHGTGTGGYVQGRDYINPAIQPIFDKLADEAWKEVTKA